MEKGEQNLIFTTNLFFSVSNNNICLSYLIIFLHIINQTLCRTKHSMAWTKFVKGVFCI